MRLENLDQYIKDNNMLQNNIQPYPGVYCITIDNVCVYVGQSKNVYERCKSHIYCMLNAMYNQEKKYLLLLSALLGGLNVDFYCLEYCDVQYLKELEDKYIEELNPKLNILTPTGKRDISDLTIEKLIAFDKNSYIIVLKDQDSND